MSLPGARGQNIVEGDVEAKDRLFPVIAYDKTAVQVYEELAKGLMKCEGISQGIIILNVFEDYAHRSHDTDLPS
jgi:hypothetical protein